MPELPEVETIKRGLSSKIVGKEITDVKFLWEKTLKNSDIKTFKKTVIGKEVKSVERRAKSLFMELSDDIYLLFHMKMTGHLLIESETKKIDKNGRWIDDSNELSDPYNQYVRAVFWLNDGNILAFSDLRKLGYVKLLDKKDLNDFLAKYGPEPFSKEFNKEYLKDLFSKKKIAIKKVIMDQRNIAGIGNIYADEILFASGIHPERPANKITEKEIEKFITNTQEILKESIKLRGTSTSDYRDTEGKKGGFESKLKVYKRTGNPCQNCKEDVKRIVVGGRGTHFCSRCQK